jgi:hypothetical protein
MFVGSYMIISNLSFEKNRTWRNPVALLWYHTQLVTNGFSILMWLDDGTVISSLLFSPSHSSSVNRLNEEENRCALCTNLLAIRKTTTSKINTLTRLLFSLIYTKLSLGILYTHIQFLFVNRRPCPVTSDQVISIVYHDQTLSYNHRENKRVKTFAWLIEVRWLNSNELYSYDEQ